MSGVERVLEEELGRWPTTGSGAAVLCGSEVVALHGPERTHAWASVTKLLTALLVVDAVHQGRLSLDEPAGPPGSTVRHLLSHSSGLSAESDRVLARPGSRRIYSNRGFALLGALAANRLGATFGHLLQERVLGPLAMDATTCEGPPAHGARGPVSDLAKLAGEIARPRHFPAAVVDSIHALTFPELVGVLPGYGRQEPNDWGMGAEIKGRKDPHWTSPRNSPETFGHFGQAGAFLWVDPRADLALVAASGVDFGPWAMQAWPRLATRVLSTHLAPFEPERASLPTT